MVTIRSVIISTADIAHEVGAPLSASYWACRHESETFASWKHRTTAAEQIDLAARHLEHAIAALKGAEAELGVT